MADRMFEHVSDGFGGSFPSVDGGLPLPIHDGENPEIRHRLEDTVAQLETGSTQFTPDQMHRRAEILAKGRHREAHMSGSVLGRTALTYADLVQL